MQDSTLGQQDGLVYFSKSGCYGDASVVGHQCTVFGLLWDRDLLPCLHNLARALLEHSLQHKGKSLKEAVTSIHKVLGSDSIQVGRFALVEVFCCYFDVIHCDEGSPWHAQAGYCFALDAGGGLSQGVWVPLGIVGWRGEVFVEVSPSLSDRARVSGDLFIYHHGNVAGVFGLVISYQGVKEALVTLVAVHNQPVFCLPQLGVVGSHGTSNCTRGPVPLDGELMCRVWSACRLPFSMHLPGFPHGVYHTGRVSDLSLGGQ